MEPMLLEEDCAKSMTVYWKVIAFTLSIPSLSLPKKIEFNFFSKTF